MTAPELVQPVESREIPLRPEPEQHAIPIAPLIRRLARAANDAVHDRPAPVSSEWASSEAGLRCVHREAGPDQVEIIIEWTRPVAEPSAVHVRVTTAGTTVEYLVILTLEASGRWAGDLLIRGAGESVATVVLGLRATASLEADDVEAVRRSVNVTARAGRNAWRAVARARPHGDPVRQAIVTALQH